MAEFVETVIKERLESTTLCAIGNVLALRSNVETDKTNAMNVGWRVKVRNPLIQTLESQGYKLLAECVLPRIEYRAGLLLPKINAFALHGYFALIQMPSGEFPQGWEKNLTAHQKDITPDGISATIGMKFADFHFTDTTVKVLAAWGAKSFQQLSDPLITLARIPDPWQPEANAILFQAVRR